VHSATYISIIINSMKTSNTPNVQVTTWMLSKHFKSFSWKGIEDDPNSWCIWYTCQMLQSNNLDVFHPPLAPWQPQGRLSDADPTPSQLLYRSITHNTVLFARQVYTKIRLNSYSKKYIFSFQTLTSCSTHDTIYKSFHVIFISKLIARTTSVLRKYLLLQIIILYYYPYLRNANMIWSCIYDVNENERGDL